MREICVLMTVAAGVFAHAASPEAEARAAAWLEAWDRQGLHRTATAGDESGAAWLAREAEAIVGRAVTSESFALDRIDTVSAFLEIDGERIEGEPFLDAPPTDAEGIRGVASDLIGEGTIAVLPVSPSVVYGPDFAKMRRESRHRAHVVVTMGGAPGLAPLNAEWFRTTFGPPTLQVSSVHRDRLLAAVARKAELRVVVHTKRTPAQARNVVHHDSRPRSHEAAGGRDDAAQLVVAIDVRARRRCGVLARDVTRAEGQSPCVRRDLHRQYRPRNRSHWAGRFRRAPARLGNEGHVDPLRCEHRRRGQPAHDSVTPR